ncbi:hypothetical protein jhhlp_008138 [Lomentospora prolificans]|uniref:Heterokaryon incompatibility domain-containing protein n=1 Tax=Lomentospora prolificans TaxID=41688 RepID=A0A2N3MZM7_9PEZI|nr:hypothetical protein jhhlp_008138 [Lomentospora prolificans]
MRLRGLVARLIERFWPRAIWNLYMKLLGIDVDRPWTYQRLDSPGQIRLFRLHRWMPFAGVRGSIVHVNLEEAPTYNAISYHWGTIRENRRIWVDGAYFEISLATHDALESYSSLWYQRLVWIDYLCIDQRQESESLVEKGKQVAMMRDIYSKAQRVIVHIPRQQFAPFFHPLLHELTLAVNEPFFSSAQLYAKYELEIFSLRWQALVYFLNAEWFSRIWIVQEVALAREVELRYAGWNYDWDSLSHTLYEALRAPEMAALLQITQKGRRAVVQLGHLHTLSQTRRLMPLVQTQRIVNESSYLLRAALLFSNNMNPEQRQKTEAALRSPTPLIKLLRTFVDFNATDPRDKVYALQGLLAEACPPELVPNYESITASELFRLVARHILGDTNIRERLSMLALAGAGYDGRRKDIPSWAPDLTCRLPAAPLSPYVWPRQAFEYKACGDTEPRVGFSDESPDILRLTAIRVDQIQAIGPALDLATDDEFVRDPNDKLFNANDIIFFNRWHTVTLALVKQHIADPYPYKPHQSLKEAFWRTLVGDATKDTRPAPSYLGKIYDDWVTLHREMLPYGLDAGRTLIMPEDDEFWARRRYVGTWDNAMAYCATGRSVCATSKGYLGCVPHWAEAGDEILVVMGSPAPLVVRRVHRAPETRYEIIGQCYLHGIMDGEMVDGDPAWDTLTFV